MQHKQKPQCVAVRGVSKKNVIISEWNVEASSMTRNCFGQLMVTWCVVHDQSWLNKENHKLKDTRLIFGMIQHMKPLLFLFSLYVELYYLILIQYFHLEQTLRSLVTMFQGYRMTGVYLVGARVTSHFWAQGEMTVVFCWTM